MVKFEYRPFEKIIIHQITQVPIEQFIYTGTIGVGDGQVSSSLHWADGIVFIHTPIPFSDEIIADQLKGIIHWNQLIYGHLEEYQEILEGPRAVKIHLIKTEDPIFLEMSKWIKNVYEKELI